MSSVLSDFEAIKTLARELSSSTAVNRYDSDEEREAWNLALAFRDMEEAFTKIYGQLIPKLLSDQRPHGEVKDILLDIGEELRHILYHINDSKFFSYLR